MKNKFMPYIIYCISIPLFIGCNDCYKVRENYEVLTYGEGLYGEQENEYPIFTAKMRYSGDLTYIPHVEQIFWNDSLILIKTKSDIRIEWWMVKTNDNPKMPSDNTYFGPLSESQKDNIIIRHQLDLTTMHKKQFK